MKLKNTFTGVALAVSVAMSSFATPAVYVKAADVSTPEITAESIASEANATSAYLQSLSEDGKMSIFDYRQLILMMQTDINYSKEFNSYMELVKSYTTDEGKIIVEGVEMPTIYAAVIDILTIASFNPADYNGVNYLKSFSDYITAYDSAEALNTAIGNPYYYSYIIPAAVSYKDEMPDGDKVLALLKDAVSLTYVSSDSGVGIDYYGCATDNNGKVLPALTYYAQSDADFNQKMIDAITWTNNTNRNADGGYCYAAVWGTDSSANSTALGLCMLTAYGYDDEAKTSYSALNGFKSEKTDGCYTYMGEDNLLATQDAFEALVTYKRSLSGMAASPYDVTAYKCKFNTITFYGNGGKFTDNKSSKKSFSVNEITTLKELTTLGTPVRKGYTFAGWYTDKTSGKKLTATATFNSKASYYAHWSKVKVSKPAAVNVKSAKKSAKVTIKKVTGANSYTIVYADNSKFKKAKKVTVSKTSATIKSLKSGKIYYVKVCANKKDSTGKLVSSSYSTVKKVKVK